MMESAKGERQICPYFQSYASKQEMIQISLLEFALSGHFGPIDKAATRSELFRVLGEPDDYGCVPCQQSNALVWKYGDIEFHFDLKGTDAMLDKVFSDEFDVPTGGTKIALEPWIVCRDLKQTELEAALRELGLLFEVVVPEYDMSQRLVQTESGVQFGFTNQDDGSPYMFAFSASLAKVQKAG